MAKDKSELNSEELAKRKTSYEKMVAGKAAKAKLRRETADGAMNPAPTQSQPAQSSIENTDVESQLPAPTENPASGIESSGMDIRMPVPDINKISPFGEEPKIEDHVTAGLKGNQSTSPPITDNPSTDATDTSGDTNIGGADIGSQAPPTPPSSDPFITDTGASQSNISDQPGQQPGNADGNTITKTQAERAFDEIIKNINYAMRHHVAGFLSVKPEKVGEFKKSHEDMQKYIRRLIDDYNRANTEALVLDDKDIEMLRDPAIACMQEAGFGMSNKDLLLLAIAQVAMRKIELMIKMMLNKKVVIAEMKELIANGVQEMQNARQSAQDILKEVQKEKEELGKKYAEMNDLFNNMKKASNNQHEIVIPSLRVDEMESNKIREESPVMA